MKNKQRLSLIFLVCITLHLASAQVELGGLVINVVNQEPDPAVVGDVVEVRLGIQNSGEYAYKNIALELVPSYPFSLVAGEDAVRRLGSLQSYQGTYNSQNIQIVKYQIRVDKDATAGNYELKVRYYEEGSAFLAEESISIDVRSRENAEIIHIDKTNIIPGRQSSLKFSINNVGNTPLRDLSFNWENEDKIILPVGSDNTRYIRYVEIGERVDLEYQVIADTNAVPGLYQLNLYLRYEDSSNSSSRTVSTIAGVYVGGGTDFDIAFSQSANGEVSFTVANIGSNPANSVSVVVPQQDAWRTTGPSSVIIGNLNKGDYTVASFKLSQGGRNDRNITAGSDTLRMQIAYTDTQGERKVVEKDVQLSIQNLVSSETLATAQARRTTSTSYSTYILIIIVILAAGYGYHQYRQRKKKNPHVKLGDMLKIKSS